MGYLDNWLKMLSGAGQVAPVESAGPPVQGTAPTRPTNPITGEPRSATYGKDVDLPAMGGDVMAHIEYLKSIGYPEDQAVRIAHDPKSAALFAGVRANPEWNRKQGAYNQATGQPSVGYKPRKE